MIVYAVALAIAAALIDYFFEIKEPWRKIVYAGVVILLIFGVFSYFVPGFPGNLTR